MSRVRYEETWVRDSERPWKAPTQTFTVRSGSTALGTITVGKGPGRTRTFKKAGRRTATMHKTYTRKTFYAETTDGRKLNAGLGYETRAAAGRALCEAAR